MRYNATAVKQILKPISKVLALDDCDWAHYIHRSLLVKVAFYEGINSSTKFAANINEKIHLLKVERCVNEHPGIKLETLFIVNFEEQIIPCIHDDFLQPSPEE